MGMNKNGNKQPYRYTRSLLVDEERLREKPRGKEDKTSDRNKKKKVKCVG